MSRIRKEMSRFLVAGISAVATDMGTYYLFLITLNPVPAKALSFLSGSVVAYLINKYWTFEVSARSYREMCRFSLLYFSTLMANVGINKLTLNVLPKMVLVAFIAATATSTVLNFVGQKWWVFKKERLNVQ